VKKFLTCTLFGITIFGIAGAQDNARSEMEQISAPCYKLTEGLNGKNFFFENNWVRAKILTANNSVLMILSASILTKLISVC
jgi:hypothetical protein